MALSNEDKKDVKTHMGKALAKKVAKVTNDKKMKGKKMAAKGGFIKKLEAHKAKGRSFDDGTWKPSKKGETFIQALERHKADRRFY